MTTASKYRLGAAALAFAGAAAMTPVIAQADIAPLAPSLTSFSQSLGSTAGEDLCTVFGGADCVTALTTGAEPTADPFGGISSLWQNNILWSCFDCQNPNYQNDPNTITISTWTPLSIFPWIPDVFPDLYNWWTSQTSETCFLGWSTTLGGPYAEPGQFKSQFNSTGCNP